MTYSLAWALPINRRVGDRNGWIYAGSLRRGDLCAMICQSLLDLLWGLHLDFFRRTLAATLTGRRVAGSRMSLSLSSVEVLDDSLVVLLDDILGYALHAEDLDVEALPVWERILDGG